MSIDITQFYQVFFEEAAEHLATMESLLLGLDIADPSDDDLNAIFRAAHSIKGGSGTFGFNDMVEVTHVLENLLDKLRKHEKQLTDEMVNVFLEAGDVINMQLAAHRGAGQVEPVEVKAVCDKLAQLNSGSSSVAPAAAPPIVATAVENTDYGFFDDVPAAPAENSDYGFFDDAPAAPVAAADPGYGFFDEAEPRQATAQAEADPGYGFFQEITPSLQAPAPAGSPQAERRASDVPDGDAVRGRRASDKAAASAEAASIRVNVEKVDQLINLVGELVITHAMLAQSASNVDGTMSERLQNGLRQLERNTRDLQEVVMSVRMLPISFVFSRYPRVVRDLAGKLNKQVELKTVGEGTELDKGLIEKIADPLTHLVRNSLDHGIEVPEKRLAAGKPAKGTITLQASHQGGNVVIEVVDDGAGLSRTRILDKARERGLPVRDDITDQEVWMLIFEAGFSTAEVVTDVSGRGVGMDVVKRNIAALGGRIELNSAEGLGTRITIRLPLTLAILDGLSVAVGSETYIIPLTYIIESLLISNDDLRSVSGAERLVHVRGEYLPLVTLREVFNLTGSKAGGDAIVVIVEAEGRKVALLVDELLGQHQVVIKSLESNFRKLPGMSGATIMGDGKVALILDVAALSLVPARHNRLVA
ncbi:MAG: two-component system, chemotaxis family, sensor kinase CheA [Gallionellaceae bacterium]|nr:MAG: two-component system, chemotaxis family, sensor kinase CheA [Gallionellaceae bacterium]